MDKVDIAIERLRVASDMSLAVYQQPLIITDSGGKDSSVLVDLALKAKIPCEIQHSHTTADAPETVRFVREKFKRLEADGQKVHISYPVYRGHRTSMWALITEYRMAPTQLVRYCCKILKEQVGKERMIATGVRWAESVNRKNNSGIYQTQGKTKSENIVLTNDNDDRRQLFENCQLKAKRVVNPIIDWSDREIWDYISAEHIKTNSLYACGWNRVGCLGCPMAGRKGRLWQFAQYPAYEKLYKIAFQRLIDFRKATGMEILPIHKNAETYFLWWMEDKNLDGQIDMFEEMEDTQKLRV